MKNALKRITPFFLFSLLSLYSFSQEQKISSFLEELSVHPQRDTIRVNLLVSSAQGLMHTKPEEALSYADEANTISTDINWQKGKALALRQKGDLYYVMANNLRALNAYQQALVIAKQIQDRKLESGLLSNLGNIHADLKEYDEALEKYRTFLNVSEELGEKSDQVKALTNIAIVYTDTDKHKEGIEYLEKALALAKQVENDFFIAAITNNLGLAYKKLKDYSKALKYYKSAVEMAVKLDNKYIEASALNSIGKVNILLGEFELAEGTSSQALKLSQELGAVEWQTDSWKVLSQVYEYQDKSAEALVAYKNHIRFRDSILGEEKRSEITRKEMQFELEMQEAEAQEEIKRQTLIKNVYLLGGIVLALTSILGYFLYKKRRDALAEKKIAEFNTKVAETELKALRSQMNPHFIFNSLNSISDYMEKNDVATANEYLLKFAKLTRNILENSEKKWIPLEEDIELTKLYMQIEAMRLKDKLFYSIKVDDEIDAENTLIPPLILQPFIENSIWHGIAKKKGKGQININIKLEDQMMLCIVEDNGVGRNKSTSNKTNDKESMGIKITRNRLDVICQLKNMKGSIEMIDKEEGLRVELKIPLELQF